MSKTKNILFSILVILLPVVFLILFGYVYYLLRLHQSRTFQITYLLSFSIFSYVVMGIGIARICAVKKIVIKEKGIIKAYIAGWSITLLLLVYWFTYYYIDYTFCPKLATFYRTLNFKDILIIFGVYSYMMIQIIRANFKRKAEQLPTYPLEH